LAHYNTVLHQLLSLVTRHDFDSLVKRFEGDRYAKTFKAWNQFTILLFAQAGGKGSLRDIENALTAQSKALYHVGLEHPIARSTLAEANARIPWTIYQELFGRLQKRCQALAPRHKFKFKNPMFSLDSTTIELCLASYPWARFSRRRGAIKLHHGLDHAGNIPMFVSVTTGDRPDLVIAREQWPIIPDSINCFDKGYVDFGWLRRIDDEGAFFVTRAREKMAYRVTGQQEIPKNKSVVADLTVEVTHDLTRKKYPGGLRLIKYFDAEKNREFEFMTNNFELAATTIAEIYKARWQIEAFFKWIKQNLKIKSFLGTSSNAVLTQVWVAMCYVLLLAYIKFQAKCSYSLFYLHRIVGQTILARLSLLDLMHLNARRLERIRCQDPQLCLQL
jgi:hypothetical protein